MVKAESEPFSDLKQVGIVARYELLKHLRRKRIYSVVAIAALIGLLQIAIPLAFNLGFPQTAKDWAWGFFSFTSFLIIIVGTFFAGDAIASEFELKTGYIVFPNPIKRVSLVFGKFVAALVSALLTIGFYYTIGTVASLGIYGVVPLEIAASFAYAFLYLCCVLGFTFLFSAVLKGSMGATLLSFFTFFLILSVMSQLVVLTGNEPWFVPTYASGSITQVIKPQQDSVMEIPGIPLKIYTFYPKDLVSAIILAAYFVATLALSMVVAKRKEMA
jgi:ABC-2 type transport system permease protein